MCFFLSKKLLCIFSLSKIQCLLIKEKYKVVIAKIKGRKWELVHLLEEAGPLK